MSDDLSDLENFSGVARLFPLPNLVLFPWVIQGLHIFEPRYRQMTADVLVNDRLIAMCLLRPGWQADYAGQPPIFPVACLGRIVADQRLEDGRYNLQLRGLCRVRIIEEIENAKLYRSARVEVLDDVPIRDPDVERELRGRLSSVVATLTSGQEQGAAVFLKLLKSDLALGMVGDILGYALPLPLESKQALLETADVERRVRLLLEHLEMQTPSSAAETSKAEFPPDFSSN